MNRPRLLGCLSFFVFIFAEFSLERIIGVHLYLLPDDFLQCLSSIRSDAGVRMWIVTVAWTPDCFRASISAPVRGWTNCPSFMSSFVASVSTVPTSLKGWLPGNKDTLTKFFNGRRRNHADCLIDNLICQPVWLAYKRLRWKGTKFSQIHQSAGIKLSGVGNSECDVRISLEFATLCISSR